MKLKKTQRGFTIGEFTDVYGEKCSIQKSSLATEDAIWLGVDSPKLTIFENEQMGRYITTEMPKTFSVSSRMHLTQKQVKELLPYLIHFAETGHLEKEPYYVYESKNKKLYPNITIYEDETFITGMSNMPHSIGFYDKIKNILVTFLAECKSKYIFHVDMEFIESASQKCFIEIFKALENNTNGVLVKWYYETYDEEMFELGEDFKDITKLEFELIEKKIEG